MMFATSLELTDQVRHRLENLPDPRPMFNVRLGWAKDYDALFSAEFSEQSGIDRLLHTAISFGRVLLTGRGGGAKTVQLNRLARTAIAENMVPIGVELKGWTANDYKEWSTLTGSSERLRYIFERFAAVGVSIADLDALRPSLTRIIILDGLNEIDSRVGQQLIDALDEYARYALNTSVIVSDRLVRRDFIRPDRWRIAMVLPIAAEEIRRILNESVGSTDDYDNAPPTTQKLLSSPYFLSQFLKNGSLGTSSSEEMTDYFSRHVFQGNQEHLRRAASAAYAVYRDSTRTFAIEDFTVVAGQEVSDALVHAGALTIRHNLGFFDHHLKHDYLASRHVAADEQLWNKEVFNRLSFQASSFDTIGLLLEQLGPPERADVLLRALYDWNIYGAGYAVAEGRDSKVSREMFWVILAMFAERRWDIVKATSERANDTLHLFETEIAHELTAAPSLDRVFQILAALDTESDWFVRWRLLFSTPINSPATDDQLEALQDQDSVIGWTTSNVLRRLHLSQTQQKTTRAFASRSEDVVRWRAVHVLGSFPSEKNARVLFRQLDRGSLEVRYGATRSLLEMSARAAAILSRWILYRLRTRVKLLSAHRPLLEEFKRAIFIDPARAPRAWARNLAPVLQEFQRTSVTFEERDAWDRVASRILETYGI